jgi:signal recognition particle subunit SRP19
MSSEISTGTTYVTSMSRFEEVDDPEEALLSPDDYPQPTTGGVPPSTLKPHMISQSELEQFKSWSVLYPIYFDASRSIREGRRVPLNKGVKNPMAKELADACASLGIQSVLEVLSS